MTLSNEFGAAGYTDLSGERRAMYSAHATDENHETIELFYNRCNQFMNKHSIKLGEGVLTIYDSVKDPEFPIELQLGAPMLEGPKQFFREGVI